MPAIDAIDSIVCTQSTRRRDPKVQQPRDADGGDYCVRGVFAILCGGPLGRSIRRARGRDLWGFALQRKRQGEALA